MTSLRNGLTSLALVALLAGPVLAQDGGAQVPGATVDQPKGIDQWTIKDNVHKIERHMSNFGDLTDTLGSAQAELAADFEAYLKDPKNEVLASGIEKKMALFADQVVHDFDRVLGDQDALTSNFKELRRKLQRFDGTVGDKVATYESKVQAIRDESSSLEQSLIAVAIKVKEAQTPAEKKALETEFAKNYRKFRLKNRNIRGYEANLQNYKVLSKNLQTLSQLFGQLQEKFGDLLANLENEKAYLVDSIELQLDQVKLKKVMNEGFFSGERAIKNVTEKLATLYLRVDAFTQVHDRINGGMGRLAETQDTLAKLSASIDEIGNGGITGDITLTSGEGGSSMEAVVDHFYKQRGKLKN